MKHPEGLAACPYCREELPAGAVVCPHCEEPLVAEREAAVPSRSGRTPGGPRSVVAGVLTGAATALFALATMDRLTGEPPAEVALQARSLRFLEMVAAGGFLLLLALVLRRNRP